MFPKVQSEVFQASGVEMTEALHYAVVFERSETGFGAFVPDLPGCISVGDTMEETEVMIREAIEGHIEAMRHHGEMVPRPSTFAKYVEVEVAVAVGQ